METTKYTPEASSVGPDSLNNIALTKVEGTARDHRCGRRGFGSGFGFGRGFAPGRGGFRGIGTGTGVPPPPPPSAALGGGKFGGASGVCVGSKQSDISSD